ncbi:hypothetical protein INS90_03955 [Trueperella pecoris]|uniref:Cell division protein FtsL n=1 Tax=Trueperella pecoris TaxID=2733571 RepID=A0A7M1R2R7_9ACTO|nr:hypothetical protein [Trueperella pecoris]QOR48431.1 hypothetical protein INS90_03955 [Trueperella pecoris]
MSIALDRQRAWSAPSSRPVIEMPGLSVVPTPAPARGFWGAVFLCLALFIGSLSVAFHLNTRMVQGAYEIKNISVELNEVAAREATLTKDVIAVSTPNELRARAEQLGLVPAVDARHVDLETGVITAPAQN